MQTWIGSVVKETLPVWEHLQFSFHLDQGCSSHPASRQAPGQAQTGRRRDPAAEAKIRGPSHPILQGYQGVLPLLEVPILCGSQSQMHLQHLWPRSGDHQGLCHWSGTKGASSQGAVSQGGWDAYLHANQCSARCFFWASVNRIQRGCDLSCGRLKSTWPICATNPVQGAN